MIDYAGTLAWGINRCCLDDLMRIRDMEQEQWCRVGNSPIVQDWNTFFQLAANKKIEHFVLFDCFLFDDVDVDPDEQAVGLARRGTIITDVLDGHVVFGFASQDDREDFVTWGTNALSKIASND